MRVSFLVVLICCAGILAAEDKEQSTSSPISEGNAVCTFEDGQQVSIRYPQVPYKAEPTEGKAWSPDNRPIYLFSETELVIGSTSVPAGAYSLYPIPGSHTWTLVLNKDVTKGSSYDPKQDLARLDAQMGKLPNASHKLTLYFGHIAPKKCTLRIDYGKQRVFADFQQK